MIETDSLSSSEAFYEESHPVDELERIRGDIVSEPQNMEQHLDDYIDTYLKIYEIEIGDISSSEELQELADTVSNETGVDVNPVITILEDIIHNRKITSLDPTQINQQSRLDPVKMFSGEFIHESNDFVVDGAGMNFVFKRIYKNQIRYAGPLGHKWSHIYNLTLRVINNTIFRSNEQSIEEVYIRHPKFGQDGFNYWVPPDGIHGIIVENGTDSLICRFPLGLKYYYERDPSRPHIFLIETIEDKNKNYLQFDYVDSSDKKNLKTVHVNNLGRTITFSYDEYDRIITIKDYTDRTWSYEYDDFGDLVSVTTPKTERYKAGLKICYEYSSENFSLPELQHNLTRIIDPAAQVYLENKYGAARGFLSFNRVTEQRQGNGISYFEYDKIVEEFEQDYSDIEKPAFQTTMIERNGHPVHYVYNQFGNLLFEEEEVYQGIKKNLKTFYRYNNDGALIGSISPEGRVTQNLYGRDYYLRRKNLSDKDDVRIHDDLTASERLSFGNLLATVRRGGIYTLSDMILARGVWSNFFPDVYLSIDQSDIIVKFGYEDKFQQIKFSSDPRYTTRADPYAGESDDYYATLTKYEYRGTQNNRSPLFLKCIEYPDVKQPDGTLLQNIVDKFADYDNNGRLRKKIDSEGIVTEYEYYPDFLKEGYGKKVIIDRSGVNNVTEYEVNERGIVTRILFPNSLISPYNDFITAYKINALDQIEQAISSPPFSYIIKFQYYKTGKKELDEMEYVDCDGNRIDDLIQESRYYYDEQNNLIKISIGTKESTSSLATRYEYDKMDMLTSTILPKGNIIKNVYDERSLLVSVTKGFNSDEVTTTRFFYSEDGLKIKEIDGNSHTIYYKYDPFGRLIETKDPQGNLELLAYNKLGKVVLRRFFERKQNDRFILLQRTEYEYDRLNRLIIQRHNRFKPREDTVEVADPYSSYLESPGPEVQLKNEYYYDKKGRLTRFVNMKGQSTYYEYDSLDRETKIIDELKNYVEKEYDPNGNLIRIDNCEYVTDPRSNSLVRKDIFTQTFKYDQLNRLISKKDSLGNVIELRYDSRNNITREIDPLKNIKRFTYDVHGRRKKEIVEITDNGLGNDRPLYNIETKLNYDKNSNLESWIDAKGNTTAQVYDDQDRVRTVVYPDKTTEEFWYDKNSNIIKKRDNNGLATNYEYNPLNYLTKLTIDKSELKQGIEIEGGTEEYDYDPFGNRRLSKNDFVEITRKFDSFNFPYEENQIFTTPDALFQNNIQILKVYDQLGNLQRITYPNGREIQYNLDQLNRIKNIENIYKGTIYIGSNIFSDPYIILENFYSGKRLFRTIYGNHTTTDYSYDKNGRIIQIRHLNSNGNNLLTLQYLFDNSGNIRIKNNIQANNTYAEKYYYNSIYWLTNIQYLQNFNNIETSLLSPYTTKQREQSLNDQDIINNLIGSLGDNPINYAYKYDSLGNRREEKQPNLSSKNYISNELNQYIKVNNTDFRYDFNGNMISDSQKRYLYNYNNRLIRVKDISTNQDICRFSYSPDGNRILLIVNNKSIHMIYNDRNIIEEYENNSIKAQYVVGYKIDSLYQFSEAGEEYWYHKDIINSTRLLSNSHNSKTIEYDYTAFGSLKHTDNNLNSYLYNGKRFDNTIEIYDYLNREYSPIYGRFLQRDKLNQLNLYSYAGNNPLSYTDILGLEKQPIDTENMTLTKTSDVSKVKELQVDNITTDNYDKDDMIVSVTGLKFSRSGKIPDESWYKNFVAKELASRELFKLANIANTEYGCLFCHTVKEFATLKEADAAVDIQYLDKTMIRIKAAKEIVEFFTISSMGASRRRPIVNKGPAGYIKTHPGDFLEGTPGKIEGAFDITRSKTYIVRAGGPGRYGDHLFTSIDDARNYAQHLTNKGENYIRNTSALPRIWSGGSPGNPVNRISVFEVPPNTPYIKGVVGSQMEGGFGNPVIYPGGGPQVLIDSRVKLGPPISEHSIP